MTLDSQTAALLRDLLPPADAPAMTMREIGPEVARAASRAIFHAYAGAEGGPCLIEDVLVDGTARPIPARLYRKPTGDSSGNANGDPQQTAHGNSTHQLESAPLVVFFHGGGWAMGDLDCYDRFMRDLCMRSGASFLSVEYRLAPESKFPAGLEDALAAVRWAATHSYGAPCLAVMGDSAGGNLAAVIARRLHAEGQIRLAAQFLLYPMLDVSSPHSAYPSRMRYGDGGYLLTRESIDTATSWYLKATDRADDPNVSPLLARDLGILPETIIVIGGHDPLLDEARRYAEALTAAGVAARLKCFETTIHAFLSFGVLEVAQEGRKFLAEEIKRCLFAGP